MVTVISALVASVRSEPTELRLQSASTLLPYSTSPSKQMQALVTGSWNPIPEELLQQVFFTDDENQTITCLRRNSNSTLASCREALSIRPGVPSPFFGPFPSKVSQECPYLRLSDIAQHFTSHRHVRRKGLRTKSTREVPSAVAAWCALDGRSLAFVGDSTVQQTYEAFYLELERHKQPTSNQDIAYAVHAVNAQQKVAVNCSRPGAILWWGCLNEVLSVDIVGRCAHRHVTARVSFIKMHLYVEYDLPYVMNHDVILVWLSFHYKYDPARSHLGLNKHSYEEDMTAMVKALSAHGRQGEGKAVIFRESMLQHFGAHETGDFIGGGNNTWCGPVRNPTKAFWSDAIVRKVLERLSIRDILQADRASPSECGAVYVLPLHDTYLSRHMLHISSGKPEAGKGYEDCTHYCLVHPLFYPLWERLELVLRHSKHYKETHRAVINASCPLPYSLPQLDRHD